MDTHEIINSTPEQFQMLFGANIEELLQPISAEKPEGEYLRYNGVYSQIKDARRFDDPSLPTGVWEYELKTADWSQVTAIAVDALQSKTKDLQLGIWLLEAQVCQHGFAGIAPSLALLQGLCSEYWEVLYPQVEEGDMEYRTNPIEWANEKLLPVIRQIPITSDLTYGRPLTWSDWEMGRRVDHARQQDDKNEELKQAIGTREFLFAMADTQPQSYVRLHGELQDSGAALRLFCATLDALCGEQAPSMGALQNLLTDIDSMLTDYMDKERILFAGTDAEDAELAGENSIGGETGGGTGGDGAGGGGPVRSRAEAYTRLSEAADFLLRDNPHSPVPYLVKQAVDWGKLSTPELYRELFVLRQGQLNIFELLGLKEDGEAT